MKKFVKWAFHGGVTKRDIVEVILMELLAQIIAFAIVYPAPCTVIEYRTVAIMYLIVAPIGALLGFAMRYGSEEK